MALQGAFTDYAEKKLLDLFLGVSWSLPGLWMALGMGDTGMTGWNDDGSTSGTEPSGAAGYARAHVTGWTAVTDSSSTGPDGILVISRASTKTSSVITFPVATSQWGTSQPLKYGAFFDAVTGGNCLFTFGLVGSGPVPAGKQLQFAANAIEIAIEDRYYTDDHIHYYLRGAISRAEKAALLAHFVGNATYPGSTKYFGLVQSANVHNNPATFSNEKSGDNYARWAATWDAASTDSDSRATTTPTVTAYSNVAGPNDWSLAGGGIGARIPVLFDASSSGNVCAQVAGASILVAAGNRFGIRAGDLFGLMSN